MFIDLANGIDLNFNIVLTTCPIRLAHDHYARKAEYFEST